MRTIIKSGKTLLFICKDRLPPIGYDMKHGMMLDDGRWLYEIKEASPYHEVRYGSAFREPDRIVDIGRDQDPACLLAHVSTTAQP